MAEKEWKVEKKRFCDHVAEEVSLEAEVVYPAEYLPDQTPRVLAHRCSKGMVCASFSQGTCIWAGTNPSYDPFTEKE